jgi:hypothetical protein
VPSGRSQIAGPVPGTVSEAEVALTGQADGAGGVPSAVRADLEAKQFQGTVQVGVAERSYLIGQELAGVVLATASPAESPPSTILEVTEDLIFSVATGSAAVAPRTA